MTKVLLSVSGGAGMFPAGFGAAYRLKDQILKEHKGCQLEYGGVSSGSIVALCLAAGKSVGFVEAPHDPTGLTIYTPFGQQFDQWWKMPLTYLFPALRKFLMAMMPEDIHTQVSGRLHIGVSTLTLTGLKFEVISHFKSRADVIEAVITSCTLFPLAWLPLRFYHGRLRGDGGYVQNEVVLKGYINYVAKYTHMSGHLRFADWYPSPCTKKSDRLVRIGWTVTEKHLQEHGLQKYRMFALPSPPVWYRLLRWFVTRLTFIYLLYQHIKRLLWFRNFLRDMVKFSHTLDRFDREWLSEEN